MASRHQRSQLPEPLPQNPKHPQPCESPNWPNSDKKVKNCDSSCNCSHINEFRVVIFDVVDVEETGQHVADEQGVDCQECEAACAYGEEGFEDAGVLEDIKAEVGGVQHDDGQDDPEY